MLAAAAVFVLVSAATACGSLAANAWLSRGHDAAGGMTSHQGELLIGRLDALAQEQRRVEARLDDVHASTGEVAKRALFIQQGLCATEGPYYCGR